MARKVIESNVTGTVLTMSVPGIGRLEVDVAELSREVSLAALIHGVKQKIADAAAIPCDPTTGRPASLQEKFDAMREVRDGLAAGEWNRGRAPGAGAGGGGETSLTIRALADVQGISPADMRGRVEVLAEKRGMKFAGLLRKLAMQPDVAKRILTLRGPASLDADALLGEL